MDSAFSDATALQKLPVLFTQIFSVALSAPKPLPLHDYIEHVRAKAGAKEAGKLRIEGSDYKVKGRRCVPFPL